MVERIRLGISDDLRGVREATAALSRDWLLRNQMEEHPKVTKEALVTLGKLLWPLSYRGSNTDDEAFTRLATTCQSWIRTCEPEDQKWVMASSFLYLPDQQITDFAAARWVDQGLPTIQLGHKYAAALMASSVEKTDLTEVPIPWKAFVIEIPPELLAIEDPETGKLSGVCHILVQHFTRGDTEPVWNYIANSTERVSLWQHAVPMNEIINDGLEGEVDWSTYSFGLKVDDRDERVNFLIGRLIVGVCLALSGKDRTLKPIGPGHKYSGDIRTASEPLQRIFQLGHPIKLDCREALSDYVEGRTKRVMTAQSLVVGHWKRQPHGPQNSLRKWIWREPFWRGPEEGPILQRSHKL